MASGALRYLCMPHGPRVKWDADLKDTTISILEQPMCLEQPTCLAMSILPNNDDRNLRLLIPLGNFGMHSTRLLIIKSFALSFLQDFTEYHLSNTRNVFQIVQY